MVPDALSGGPHFAAFCERYIRQTKGRWAGNPLLFEPWQREFWWEALELDPRTGRRIYTEVGLGLPRKNTKSTMASAAGHYFLVADGEAEPEVYIGAAARNQAGIVLGQMRTMARRSPGLLDLEIVRRYSIECPGTGGIARALASDGALQHGLNPSANIIDELHAHKDASLYTALTTGTAAREQPFTLWISTAGVAGQGILAEIYQSMFDGPGELEDRESLRIYRDRANGVLIYWYGAPRDADIEDPAVWLATNPISYLQDGKYLAAQFARLKSRGALLEWRMYHLNQFGEHEESWLPPGRWAACRDETDRAGAALHGLRADLPIAVGVDRAQTSDAAAIVVAQRQGELCVVRSRLFVPADATGQVDSEAMRVTLRELKARFPMPAAYDENAAAPLPGPAFAYDPTSFGESAEILDGEGLNMVRYPQTDALLAPATTLTHQLVSERRLRHDGDAILAEHVGASKAKLTERGMRITKLRRGSPVKNVAAVGLVMAVGIAMAEVKTPPPEDRRVYSWS